MKAVLPPPLDTRLSIELAEGRAFGDGRHDTTALCLQAVSAFAPRARTMLDFGSGTGLLSIVAAKLGVTAHGVEIDEDALASASESCALNGVEVTFARELPANTRYDLVVANILRGILLEYRISLVACVAGPLVLSGLTSTDVPEVSAAYAQLLGGNRPEVYSRGEWRALVWRSRHLHDDATGGGT